MPNSKSSQITIFVILALIFVVLVILFLLLRNPPETVIYDEENPQGFIEACAREAVEEAISILSPQGGDISPKGSVMYDGVNIVYLCYNGVYYSNCINQRPLLVEHIENEITNYITPKIADCFDNLQTRLKRRYDVEASTELKIRTRLYPKIVSVDIEKNLKTAREDKVRQFDKYKMNLVHPLYNFAEIAMGIANQETRFCNFDVLGYMILYPEFDVTETITGDSDKIYVIKERATGEEFHFATKSCLLPPGM